MATPPPAECFRQKDVTHEYCGITTNSPSPNQCSVRQIISGARAHDKQCSETLCITLLIFWWSTMLSVCPPPVHGRSLQLPEDVSPPRPCSGTSHRSAQLQRFAVFQDPAPMCPLSKIKRSHG
ncbi:hypothetical protein J6590_056651 [Homalodisca vitripennis]|nr:hypothetical protein J6590_056651 [Homalodisca vitripennis]